MNRLSGKILEFLIALVLIIILTMSLLNNFVFGQGSINAWEYNSKQYSNVASGQNSVHGIWMNVLATKYFMCLEHGQEFDEYNRDFKCKVAIELDINSVKVLSYNNEKNEKKEYIYNEGSNPYVVRLARAIAYCAFLRANDSNAGTYFDKDNGWNENPKDGSYTVDNYMESESQKSLWYLINYIESLSSYKDAKDKLFKGVTVAGSSESIKDTTKQKIKNILNGKR